MKEELLAQIDAHLKKFNHFLTEKQKFELATLYDLNHEFQDETSLTLYIEQYVRRNMKAANDDWMKHRRQSVSARAIKPDTFDLPNFEKDKETFDFLISKLSGVLFDIVSIDQKEILVKSMLPVLIEKGTEFIKQGERGYNMFIIQHGELDIYVNNVFTKKIMSGAMFGEIALLHDIPRTATVIAATRSLVWSAEQTSFTCIRMRDLANKKEIAKQAMKILIKIAYELHGLNNKVSFFESSDTIKINYDLEKLKNSHILEILYQIIKDQDENALNKIIDQSQELVTFKFLFSSSSLNLREGEFVIIFKDSQIIENGEIKSVYPRSILFENFDTIKECDCGIVNLNNFKI